MSTQVTRYDYGDVIAVSDGPMTVEDLIRVLGHMPGDAVVLRYCDEQVSQVLYEHPSNSVSLT